jgi:hypothetical protein
MFPIPTSGVTYGLVLCPILAGLTGYGPRMSILESVGSSKLVRFAAGDADKAELDGMSQAAHCEQAESGRHARLHGAVWYDSCPSCHTDQQPANS